MSNEQLILKIALPVRVGKTFDYLLSADYSPDLPKIGARIKVPFGKRQEVGILLEIAKETSVPKNKLRPIVELLDHLPLFDHQILKLYHFTSAYYQYPLGEVIFASLPPLLREGASAQLAEEAIFLLSESGANTSAEDFKRAVQQQKIIQLLKDSPNGLSRQEILKMGSPVQALTALLAKGYVRKIIRKPSQQVSKKTDKFLLNEHQEKAVKDITQQEGYETFLLEGVTGSGKTEVYLQCIEKVLKKNKQALVLVPEIGLTPQTVARFQSRFHVPISILHSNLGERERANAWLSALRGKARVIIGTRSAVLTPLPDLGIIILDEEHDLSFKQQSGLRYSAKNLAVMRGKIESVPVILGTATPSLETLFNSQQNRFALLRLPTRAGKATLPAFHVIDVRNQKLIEGFSSQVLEKMEEHLKNKGQVLIFLNRRGFAPALVCHRCGWVANCSHCDAKLTYHSQLERLVCHHCASFHHLFNQCHVCRGSELLLLGFGTQRIEKMLRQYFPAIPIVRIDRDTTQKKGSIEALVSSVHLGGSQILIGTQMLAKGHHFPDVTMVVIIDIDNALHSSDFRASERLGQIIVQVSGRAGRSNRAGEVYLQTHHPEHPLLFQLLKSGYGPFAEHLLNERKSAMLPPYSHLALLRAEAKNAELPTQFLEEIKNILLAETSMVNLYGPIPALMEKKAGKFRAQLLLQSKKRSALQRILPVLICEAEKLPLARKVRWSLDVDPVEVL